MKKTLAVGITGATLGGLLALGLAIPAQAEITQDTAATLIESALATEDVTITDPTVLADLAESLVEAESLGDVDPAIVEAVTEDPAATDGTTETPAPTETAEPLDELLADNEEEQLDVWAGLGEAIKAAFQLVRTQFDECRAA